MQLNLTQKFVLCAISFLVPIAVQAYYMNQGMSAQIEFARQEELGNQYQRPLMQLMAGASDYQIALILSSQGKPVAAEISKAAATIDDGFNTLTRVDNEIGERLKFNDEELTKRGRAGLKVPLVMDKWKKIKDNGVVYNESVSAQLASLMADLRGMIAHAGDTSNLILDPDLDTYYLMDVTLLALPQTINRIHDIRNFFIPRLEHPETISSGEHMESSVMSRMLKEADRDRVVASMNTSFTEDQNFYSLNDNYKQKISPLLDKYVAENTLLVEQLQAIGEGKIVPAETFLLQANAAMQTAALLWEHSAAELDEMLETRIAHFENNQTTSWMITILAVLVAITLYWFASSTVRSAIQKIQISMVSLAGGKLDTVIPFVGKKDEIGDMARALQAFQLTAVEARELSRLQIEDVEKQKQRQAVFLQSIKEFDSKASTLLQNVSSTADQMYSSAEGMVAEANMTNSRTQAVMTSTDVTSNNVNAVAAAAEELSASINEISSQVNRSAEIARNASEKTRNADGTVKQLSESAARISEVIKLISDIAEQINLLALNATIESARAGDAGKGFAVVASEVKSLASETSKATEGISKQISDIQHVAGDVVKVLTEIGGTINQMNEVSTVIASAVEEQGAATMEIARNIQTAASGVQTVSQDVQAVESLTTKTEGKAKEVLDAARNMSTGSENLRGTVFNFLENIRKI